MKNFFKLLLGAIVLIPVLDSKVSASQYRRISNFLYKPSYAAFLKENDFRTVSPQASCIQFSTPLVSQNQSSSEKQQSSNDQKASSSHSESQQTSAKQETSSFNAKNITAGVVTGATVIGLGIHVKQLDNSTQTVEMAKEAQKRDEIRLGMAIGCAVGTGVGLATTKSLIGGGIGGTVGTVAGGIIGAHPEKTKQICNQASNKVSELTKQMPAIIQNEAIDYLIGPKAGYCLRAVTSYFSK